MIFRLFSKARTPEPVERLYAEIVARARQPVLYQPGYDVADTLEGRFEMFVLHAFVTIGRLSRLPDPGPEWAQSLTDRLFAGFDAGFREMSMGDAGISKRLKTFAAAYRGRCRAYARGLAGEESLEAAVARNVYESSQEARGSRLAAYLRAATALHERAGLADFESGRAPFPDPGQIEVATHDA